MSTDERVVEGKKLAPLGVRQRAWHLQACGFHCRHNYGNHDQSKEGNGQREGHGIVPLQPPGAHDYSSLLVPYCDTFHLRQLLLVRLTGFSPGSVTKWRQGEPPSAKQENALVKMDRLLDGLSRVMEPARVGRWLKQPNAACGRSTPLQVVERGEMDRIWRMLCALESGQPG